jgi:hypothetical protein
MRFRRTKTRDEREHAVHQLVREQTYEQRRSVAAGILSAVLLNRDKQEPVVAGVGTAGEEDAS